jgi:hypothetical protein
LIFTITFAFLRAGERGIDARRHHENRKPSLGIEGDRLKCVGFGSRLSSSA